MEKILETKNLTKSFGALKAVDSVSISLYKGEILGLIGPNGAGKSTFLKLITGIIKPDYGKIFLKNKNITNLKPYKICRLGIAKTSQIVKPFTNLTIFENIYLAAINGGNFSSSIAKNYTYEILEFVGLYPLKEKIANEINLLEKKKLELARALATNPDVLLLDENMSGLTSKEIEEALITIRKINEKGISIIIVEHIMKIIKSLSNRIIVLNFGKKIADDLPESICNNREVLEAYFG